MFEEHPEKVDPIWFQDLIQNAFERKKQSLYNEGMTDDDGFDAAIEAMWYVFEVRNNLTELYQAGRPEAM